MLIIIIGFVIAIIAVAFNRSSIQIATQITPNGDASIDTTSIDDEGGAY